jgi:hypothetical protein
MLAILNCQSEDIKSYRRGNPLAAAKRDGGKGEPHLLSFPIRSGNARPCVGFLE